MALQKQLVPVKLSSGIDTKTDQKQLIPGKLLSLQNGVFSNGEGNSGQAINKRPGYASLTNLSSGATLDTISNQVIAGDMSALNSYSPSSSSWTKCGNYLPLDTGNSTVTVGAANYSISLSQADSAYLNGLYLYTWSVGSAEAGGEAYYSVVDSVSGTVIVEGASLADFCLKVVAFPSINAFVIFLAPIFGDVSYQVVYTATPTTISGETSLGISVGDTTFYFDAVTTENYLWFSVANGTDIILQYIDSSLTSHSVLSSSSSATCCAITPYNAVSSNNVYLVYGNTSSLIFVGYGTGGIIMTSATITSFTPIALTAIATSTNSVTIFAASSTILYQIVGTNTSGTGSLGTLKTMSRGVIICNRAFLIGSSPYVIASINSDTTNTSALLYLFSNTTDLNGSYSPLAKLGFELAINTDSPNGLANANLVSSHYIEFCYLSKPGLKSGVTTQYLNFAPPYLQRASRNDGLLLGGGMLTSYDGARASEQNFHRSPSMTVSTSSSGTSTTAYSFSLSATYDFYDALGNHVQSIPAPAQSFTFTQVDFSITPTVSTLRQTAKQSQTASPGSTTNEIVINVWMTIANGTAHYLTATKQNDPTVDSITFPTINSAPTIGLSLYTDSGEVDTVGPPAFTLICPYRDRIMAVPSEARTSIWYSKEKADGYPVEFSDLFVLEVTPSGGNITAIIQMDSYFIFFKAASPYYITGYGPAANGTNNDFTPEQIITSPVGTTNPASVVLTPDGIMFQASNGGGIWLLDRSLDVMYYGAEVEAYNSYNVTSAVLIPNTTQVRFTLSNGTALVWDYLFKQWSVFTNISAVAATVYQGVYTYLTAAGVVNQETPGTYTDNGSFIQLSLTTGWLPFAGVQGFQRVYKMAVLGEYFSPHNLNVQIAYDYAGSTAQTDTIVASATLPYEYRILIGQQKCTAIQVQIQDQQSSSYGQGLSLSHLAFEVGVKGGIRRIGQSQTYG